MFFDLYTETTHTNNNNNYLLYINKLLIINDLDLQKPRVFKQHFLIDRGDQNH